MSTSKRGISAVALMLSLCGTSLGDSGTMIDRWTHVGPSDVVKIDDAPAPTITVAAAQPASAGGLSSAVSLGGADVVIVTAKVNDAPIRGLTIALQDRDGDETLGYWQNFVPIGVETLVVAALPLTGGRSEGRLFVGTHMQPSTATVKDVKVIPAARGAHCLGTVWGVRVDATREACQSFKASGPLVAVTVRLQQFKDEGAAVAVPCGLRVRVYEWAGDIAKTRRGEPIAQGVLPAELIPSADEAAERDVTVAIQAPTRPGKTYLLGFSAAAAGPDDSPAPKSAVLLLFGGPDGYAGGQRFENDQPHADWDLYFETYYEK